MARLGSHRRAVDLWLRLADGTEQVARTSTVYVRRVGDRWKDRAPMPSPAHSPESSTLRLNRCKSQKSIRLI